MRNRSCGPPLTKLVAEQLLKGYASTSARSKRGPVCAGGVGYSCSITVTHRFGALESWDFRSTFFDRCNAVSEVRTTGSFA